MDGSETHAAQNCHKALTNKALRLRISESLSHHLLKPCNTSGIH